MSTASTVNVYSCNHACHEIYTSHADLFQGSSAAGRMSTLSCEPAIERRPWGTASTARARIRVPVWDVRRLIAAYPSRGTVRCAPADNLAVFVTPIWVSDERPGRRPYGAQAQSKADCAGGIRPVRIRVPVSDALTKDGRRLVMRYCRQPIFGVPVPRPTLPYLLHTAAG